MWAPLSPNLGRHCLGTYFHVAGGELPCLRAFGPGAPA